MAGVGAKIFVDRKLAQRKVLLFAKTYSPESQSVKKILDDYNMRHTTFEVVNVEARQDCNQIENYFQILCLTDRREVCFHVCFFLRLIYLPLNSRPYISS